eukprot:gene27202-35932_t
MNIIFIVAEKSERIEVLLSWLAKNSTEVDKLLSQHRGILFRGFGAESPADFDKIVVASGYNGMEYVGGAAVRTQLTSRVFTANEIPPENDCGGETPILPSAEVCRIMFERHEPFMRSIEEKGVRYIRFMPKEDDPTSAIGRGWKSTFNCQSKGWNDSRNSGAKAVVTGDGAFLDPAAVEAAASIMDDLAVSIPWQQGDILLLDNRTVMHSRKPFTGKRRILASLVRHPDR